MTRWHTCKATHCRAGWVVELADERGHKFAAAIGIANAAFRIYHASDPNCGILMQDFYASNAEALRSMELEALLEDARQTPPNQESPPCD